MAPGITVCHVMQQRGSYSRISIRMCTIFREGNKPEYPSSKCWYFTALSLDFVALQYSLSNLKIILSDVRTALLVIPTFWRNLEGCLAVLLPHEIKCNANLMQLGNFIDVFLARHVSGTYAHHQRALYVELQLMVFCTEFLDGWWS